METVLYTAENIHLAKNKGIRLMHGMFGTRVYSVWSNMIQRCTNNKYPEYIYYGARGIGVCESWLNFLNFYNDIGDIDKNLQIDRINNDLGYCKENCRKVSVSINMSNRRKPNNKNNKFRGVYKHPKKDKYIARIVIQKTNYYIGEFENEKLASLAFLEIFKEWYGRSPVD